jgi:hypothetical protein
MNRRDFPGHAAWTETRLNGDHVPAFIAIKLHHPDIEPQLHQVYDRTHFKRRSDGALAAQDALSKLLHIDEYGCPVFSSPDC